MGNVSKSFSLLLILILAVSSLIVAKPALAQTTTPTPQYTSSPTPAPVNSTIQVSGMLSHWDLQFQFTEIEFQVNQNLTYDTPVQNGFYSISLPNHQVYAIVGTWGGRTTNATGILCSGIALGTLNLNAGAGVTSITQDLPAPNPTPPPITQSTPTATPTDSPTALSSQSPSQTPTFLEFPTWIILLFVAVIILLLTVFTRKRIQKKLLSFKIFAGIF